MKCCKTREIHFYNSLKYHEPKSYTRFQWNLSNTRGHLSSVPRVCRASLSLTQLDPDHPHQILDRLSNRWLRRSTSRQPGGFNRRLCIHHCRSDAVNTCCIHRVKIIKKYFSNVLFVFWTMYKMCDEASTSKAGFSNIEKNVWKCHHVFKIKTYVQNTNSADNVFVDV